MQPLPEITHLDKTPEPRDTHPQTGSVGGARLADGLDGSAWG